MSCGQDGAASSSSSQQFKKRSGSRPNHIPMPHLKHLEPLTRPFTPVSPSNLEPLTSRSQQVTLAELNNFNGPRSGRSTPLTIPSSPVTSNYFFDEEDDKRAEIRADAERPFPVDRPVLKEIVAHKMGSPVIFLQFLSSGTFHKAFLVHLHDGEQVVARLARRFMPSLKVESEVATINYLRAYTNIPVPTVYHYDSNPYNKLGYEYIIMSKAPGVPLSTVYSRLSDEDLRSLLRNLALLVIPLFAHRFPKTGSLYQSKSSSAPTLPPIPPSGLASTTSSPSRPITSLPDQDYKSGFEVGPIVSWPFFGEGRGELDSTEIDRGPWASEREYLEACARREIDTVRREAAGTEKGHKPHLPPTSRLRGGVSSRSHSNTAVASLAGRRLVPLVESSDEETESSSSDESSDSSVEETFYRDYRSNLRSSLLVAQHASRLNSVTDDMERFIRYMTKELGLDERDPEFAPFAFHLHDLSLTNIFVDPDVHSKVTCIIDWESTTIRPLWHCAHLPTFLQPTAHNSHAREAAIFREEVAKMGPLGELWLRAEKEREPWREAHRYLEWDGWEEGLLTSVIGDKGYRRNGIEMLTHAHLARVGVGGSDDNDGGGKVGFVGGGGGHVHGTFKMKNGFIGLSLT